MRLSINLATRRYINLPRLNAALLVAFALLGALAVLKATQIGHNAAELARLDNLTRGIATRGGGVRVTEAQLKAQASRIRFANAAIDKKSLNWLHLLDCLEEVVPAGVTLTQIDPDRAQQLKVTGAARSFANLRALLENMEHSKNFSEVYLLSQSDTKVGLTQEGVFFTLGCKVVTR